jgi:hypothetical protein
MRGGGVRAIDRADVLEAAFVALANGIRSFRFDSAVTDATMREHHLLIDIELADGPTARFCDLLFHGSPDAHQHNGELFIAGGVQALAEGIVAFRDKAIADRHHRRKRDRMRGAK